MQLTCLQDNLSRALSVVGRAVATRPTLPILSHVLLATDRSQLKLAATDLELSIVCWIGARVEQEGAIAVSARLLADLSNSWPPGRIDLNVTQETLHLACGTSEASIKGIDAQQFPLVSERADERQVQIDPDLLRQTISRVVFAAATEQARPILSGVLVSLDEDTLTMVAADGFRLSICRANLSHSDAQPIRAIIPARALNELARIGADETQPISLHIRPARSQALFRLQGGTGAKKGRIFSAELVTQLIEGDYVDYYRLIPKSHTTRTIVDREWLLQACKTARIFVRNETNDIYLNLEPGDGSEPGRVRLTATSTAIGDSADETSAAVEGEPVEIGFDVRFLIDVLRVIDDAQIVLETTGPTRFAVIHPLGSDNFVHILAPMITPRLR